MYTFETVSNLNVYGLALFASIVSAFYVTQIFVFFKDKERQVETLCSKCCR